MGKGLLDTVIDDVMDAYVEWREECAEVEVAYLRWSIASPTDALLAFAAYVAALDREDRASSSYAEVIQRAAAVQERVPSARLAEARRRVGPRRWE
ncbi:MAG TPA: hypothetical protein VK631_24650 [Solirubrobacteraceae bacterium]|nr:hypothetical protein [Solirubrobacteraceae bacterium]